MGRRSLIVDCRRVAGGGSDNQLLDGEVLEVGGAGGVDGADFFAVFVIDGEELTEAGWVIYSGRDRLGLTEGESLSGQIAVDGQVAVNSDLAGRIEGHQAGENVYIADASGLQRQRHTSVTRSYTVVIRGASRGDGVDRESVLDKEVGEDAGGGLDVRNIQVGERGQI